MEIDGAVTHSPRPFDHWVIDDFIDQDRALILGQQFPEYDSPLWFTYDNAVEKKKTLGDWRHFPPETYAFFHDLCSNEFVDSLARLTGIKDLVPDHGLYGAGWHMHARDTHLNLHLDYYQHPRSGLFRRLNLIVYLSPDWDPQWGGALQLWPHDPNNNSPAGQPAIIAPKLARAVVFDTTANSWHGFPDALTCPDGVYRKSIAMYYLTRTPPGNLDTAPRRRALYVPSEHQKNDKQILDFIQQRSQ